ncbi:putative membrane protein [Candidatus Rhodobacter oscarellae]|uniref:Putative membrane protein n=2 Tax=Candidatus Rhodobacter oscarellae TaxID=1675527 RepID=A0A0J9EGE1_9RHOB|nr:putative membrane protein [Candidatus Rhodobacter lobularis]
MLGFCAVAPMGDSIAKYLGPYIPLGQILTVRFAVQALVLLPLVFLIGQTLWMSPRNLWLTFLRTVLHILGVGAMFLSLRYLPLADAVAIAFVMPFIMLLLGWLVLGEEVGHRRLIACAVGFAGTLLVVQPSFAEVGLPALLPLFVALIFALFMLVTRQLAKVTHPVSMQCLSGLMACVLLLPFIGLSLQTGWAPFALVMPSAGLAWLLLLLGLLGSVGHILMTLALRFAPTATVAPMQYLEIPFAMLFGWLIFRDFPNGLAALGIAITIGAGLYVIYRERVTARSAPQSPAAAPPAAE